MLSYFEICEKLKEIQTFIEIYKDAYQTKFKVLPFSINDLRDFNKVLNRESTEEEICQFVISIDDVNPNISEVVAFKELQRVFYIYSAVKSRTELGNEIAELVQANGGYNNLNSQGYIKKIF